jgi:uracil-DNA glycosylase family 4
VPDAPSLETLEAEIVECRRCPRLVEWREEVARVKRSAFADQEYWGRPIPGFGDPAARIVVVGLAPAAHGGNRTGRIFTGDRSGDWLFAAMWRAGLANQPQSVSRDDGLTLHDAWVCAAVRCAPPVNRPTPAERDNCLPWLVAELGLLERARVLVCLGGFAWDATMRVLDAPRPRAKFAHGAETAVGPLALVGSYHVSQQNTFTGRLTEPMLDAVFARANELAAAS